MLKGNQLRKLAFLVGLILSCGSALVAEPPREVVQGIGGFFFKSEHPEALASWYEKHLGILPAPTSYDATPWTQQSGVTIFAPFPAGSKDFGPGDQRWMLNFRVANLERIVAQLRAEGIAVDLDRQTYPNGRFANLKDPEGNPIQLWQSASP